jgi:eukaryotic-like serine/threonine-protein kinase
MWHAQQMAITFAHARIRPNRIDRHSAVAFMRLGALRMTPDPNDALELARRIADGEALDLEKLEANNPNLARGMRKLGLLAKAMQTATPAGTSWGHLQQLQLAGHGGFGEVYRAYDPTLDRIVALKLKREDADEVLSSGREFVAEARRLARVRHPHVLAVHGASFHNNRAGLWADWIEGETLSARLQRSGPLRGVELLRVLRELAEAMDAIHKSGLVHGDIKASNVMLDVQGRVILMDFGAGFESSEQGTTMSAGTLRYLAPEVADGKSGTLAVDLYAFGVLAHLLASNRFIGDVDQGTPIRPRGLRALIKKLLDPNPAARPRADQVSERLQYLIDAPKRRTRHWLLASVLMGLIGIVIATTIGLRREQTQRQIAERVSDFLATLYREQDPLSRNAESARPPAVLVADAIARVESELAGDPRSQAQLLRVLGEAQLNLSELNAAHITLDLAASRVASINGSMSAVPPDRRDWSAVSPDRRDWSAVSPDRRDLLLSAEIDALRGAVARRELRNEAAEAYFSQALAKASAIAGPESVAVGRINALSASTLLALSHFKDARIVAQNAYQVLTKQLGPNHPESIHALVSLAAVQEQLREDAQALTSLRTAISLIEQRYGNSDARLLRPLQLLGEVLRRQRDFTVGRRVLDRGVDVARLRLGARNTQLAEILTTRSRLESEAGEHNAAIAALDAAELALPESEIQARAQLLAARGKIWIELQDGKRAEPDLRAALKLRRETGGLRSGIAWFSQAELGWALALQGRFEEAQTLLSEAERELRVLLGPDAYQNALIAVRRALAYHEQRDWGNAAVYFRESIRIEEKFFGPDHYLHFSWSLALASSLSKLIDGRKEASQILDALILRWGEKNDIVNDYAHLMLLRCDVYAANGERAAARALAVATLARADLIVNTERRAALQRHASGH